LKTQVLHTLQSIFGYADFRPSQLDIVMSAMTGQDCLALLPTGGGKSICYQVPALTMEGICLVVSPLVALMKDQVDNLRKRGVLAVAIYSGMNKREIDRVLDNCIYGNYKFLYVSPERLKTEIFIERFKSMKINLIAVDESHCISQWGYDFRPPYLEIAKIRVFHPDVPCMALTASATDKVKQDIIEKLELRNPQIFMQSYARKNLSYSVRMVENKIEKAGEILNKIPGSSIIYVRNRKGTKEIAQTLQRMGISATYYHAGLDVKERDQKQLDWKSNKIRVMVATNAFGMGIDKPDVRVVIHLDVPENLENYYQEAGRAGRDEKKAYGVLLANGMDIKKLIENAEIAYPPVDFLKKVYQCMANFYRIAVGSSLMISYDFDFNVFVQTYQLEPLSTYQALKVLQEEGMLELNASFYQPSSIHFLVNQTQLYEFQIANAKLDPLIKVLMRTYGGELFSEYLKIQENKIASIMGISESQLISQLEILDQNGILAYNARKDKPQITFLTPRYDALNLPLNQKRIIERRNNTISKARTMVEYLENIQVCRSIFISRYFGEESEDNCEICDLCLENKWRKTPLTNKNYLKEKILKTLNEGKAFSIGDLLKEDDMVMESTALEILREMEEEDIIVSDQSGCYQLNQK
jgi:ATP-dependent DNA helicase RecQ